MWNKMIPRQLRAVIFLVTNGSGGEVGSHAMLTCFSLFQWSNRGKTIQKNNPFSFCLINWRAEFEEEEEKYLQCNPHTFCLANVCGPLTTVTPQETFQMSSFTTTCSKESWKKSKFQITTKGSWRARKAALCQPHMVSLWNTDAQKTPRARGRKRTARPAAYASQGILGEKADGKDILPISKREGLLLHLQTEGLKTAFTENCVCLWAHRSFCCLAASVGIYCLSLQFSKKFSKLPDALTFTFQSTNTTSYLPGKAEFRTSTTYKKTWAEKAFSSIQPQTTATNHTALVLWTLQKNSKVCVKSCHHQTEVVNTLVFRSASSHWPHPNSLKQTMTVIHPFLNLSALAAV